ncbi:hypothetical protein V6N11_012243 [Hibiscus sabdariffa]|uniref:J domain-containing protein n=1 Tax=Hibiscus sabdariffa TaxID=183260 RepID=A0ABR2QAJ7_9ROSI
MSRSKERIGRKLALKYHPDKNPGNEEANKRFADISNGKSSPPLFLFFGGGTMEEEERIVKGDDVIVELEVTLENLYMGGALKVWREKNILKPAPGRRRCNCRNEVYHRQIGPGMFQQMTEQVCEQCQNIKYEREGYTLTVDIDKGMQDGQEVVFYEDGEPIVDGEPGDLKVEALVGFEKTFQHLDDHSVDIGFKGITKPKEVRKFKGEGMPLHLSKKKGDLYVTYDVLFPTSLTEDHKSKFKQLLD